MALERSILHRTLAAAGIAGVLGAGTVALAQSGGASATSARAASASATAYARVDGDGARHGYVSVSGTGSDSKSGTYVAASTAGGHASATARVRLRDVSIFGGLVTADTVTADASATNSGTSRSGRVLSLAIDGADRGDVTRRHVYDLNGYGKLVALDTSSRGITALRATLTRTYHGHPAGTTVQVGYAGASARDAVAPPKPKPPPRPTPKPHPAAPKHHTNTTPAHSPAKPAKPKHHKPSRAHILLTGKGYVFPVYGKHNYTDTFGAPRADTGFHEGVDIFANAGTPVVAVCDGTLNRVGTLPISGNRLWVKCTRGGDGFFYAHLSSFATATHSRAKVRAGQVLGFVGSTGDAEQTPPHLHFEVHPGDGPAVDPYPFLRAWEQHRDVPAAAWVRRNGTPGEDQPGTLVVVRDFLDR